MEKLAGERDIAATALSVRNQPFHIRSGFFLMIEITYLVNPYLRFNFGIR